MLSPTAGGTLINLLPEYGNRPLFVAASRDDPEAYNTASQLRLNARGEVDFQEYDTGGRGVELLTSDPDLEANIALWLNSLPRGLMDNHSRQPMIRPSWKRPVLYCAQSSRSKISNS